ncbi:hypothetical protein EYF80_017383 [Liparis tanakae]|uniref:Uncharacterized protein n=1 Tax=Liparis tanakae TaxID=230148 RepID=A0A4Z2I4X6_9TELE|nr:hypothetical protein EYF80_017383 [Liparis tanakae]
MTEDTDGVDKADEEGGVFAVLSGRLLAEDSGDQPLWYFKCFCFLGWVLSFRFMWLENSVKYRKPFSPQPMQFPRKPGKRRSTAHTSRVSGREGDLTPTSVNAGGRSEGSGASEDRRRSLPA